MSTNGEEVKVKKEKSSKKRKSEALSDRPKKVKKSTTVQSVTSSSPPPNPLITDENPAPDTAMEEDQLQEERPTKKRKASIEEIEVDITKPEPPSKKGLRLLKKGKPLPPSKSGADPSPEEVAAKEKKEAEKRSEHAVWIGNLAWSVSKDALRKFFTEYSDITDEQITRIHMPSPQDSKSANKVQENKFNQVNNKGFAYVDFSTAKAVEQAIELSEQLLGGRKVLIKNHKSFEGRPEKTKEETRAQGKPPNKRVFIGNLSFDTTQEILQEHFERCGPIATVFVATFEDSGKCKGYAWVTFEELEAAESAVRGYVMIKEEIEDDESEDESDAGSEVAAKVRATKTRKWWLNKLKGRPMKLEFAEDAQVRYKKRYGKDGTKNKEGGNGMATTDVGASRVSKPAPEYRQAYAPRLTGGIIASEGKKTTF